MPTNINLQKTQDAIIAGNSPQIVLSLLSYALDLGASDIHMEPSESTVRVRFRIDGVLSEIIEYPANIHLAVVSRIKIQSNMKIDEQRKPQDGRLQMFTEDRREIELRVSSMPTIHGEKICMRLQDKNRTIPMFDELGIRGNNLKRMRDVVKNPNGINLVTGPTGSGKTTTLYSTLYQLNNPDVNIMTFEDPVEYEMGGLSQSQVHPDIGYDFASGLRTALRQDPDIIMVGEIRDQETIEIAIKAALTGHMVLSTIHTNSSIATITRILDMGVQAFKITSTLRTVEAQRLVRKLCPVCKEEYEPAEAVRDEIRKNLKATSDCEFDYAKLDKNFTLFRPKGCEKCGNMGYKGRMGVYEVMEVDREIEKMVLDGASEADLEDKCIEKGMLTLLQDGYFKAMDGQTSLEEVYKVASGSH
jgi:type IV pilus assembly protein PilB